METPEFLYLVGRGGTLFEKKLRSVKKGGNGAREKKKKKRFTPKTGVRKRKEGKGGVWGSARVPVPSTRKSESKNTVG